VGSLIGSEALLHGNRNSTYAKTRADSSQNAIVPNPANSTGTQEALARRVERRQARHGTLI